MQGIVFGIDDQGRVSKTESAVDPHVLHEVRSVIWIETTTSKTYKH